MATWGDLAARARGLATRLIPEPLLAEIERAGDRAALTAALHRAGLARDGDLETGLRRRAADDVAILERWAGDRSGALAVVLDDEDRRSLRALIRGLAAGAPMAARLAGTTPGPRLPAALLAALAAQPSPVAFADLLRRRGHPYADVLAPVLRRSPLDLLEVEVELARAFAARCAHARPLALGVHVTQVIDAENAGAALVLAVRGHGVEPARCFVRGGDRLGLVAFVAAATDAPAVARDRLARVFAHTPIAEALAGEASLEDAALAWHLATQGRLRRLDPTGPASLVWLFLRRRQEARRIRRAAWRLALAGTG